MEDPIFDDQSREEMPVDFNRPEPSWRNFFSNFRVAIIAVIASIIIVGIFWLFLSNSSRSKKPASNNVILQIKGPSQITSGNEAEYKIEYKNGENADLVGLSLELLYPSGFKYKSGNPSPSSASGQSFTLPTVRAGEGSEVVIRGKLSGGTGEDKQIQAKLHYRLSNFNSEFSVAQSTHTMIQAPNLVMDINGPVDVVNGQDTTFNVTITNVTNSTFDNLAVEIAYPLGFTFTTASTLPSKSNNYWKLPLLGSGASQSLEITGSFMGVNREEKLVRADLGQIINNNFAPQINSTASFRIMPSSLTLSISAQPSAIAKLGDTINYKLDYANNGPIGLSNLVISLNLDGPSLDFARLSASSAIVTGHTLTWKAATLPSLSILSPNERGQITFTIPMRSNLTTNLKNQTITASANIIAQEMSKATKALDSQIKLSSTLELAVLGDYVSGAAPMKVGEPTVINMTFLLSNLSNDLTNTEVIASLPLPASAWTNIILPESEAGRLSYDPNSGKIRWKLGNVPAFTGKFIPVLSVTFQLNIVPVDSDKGKNLVLLTNIQAAGNDSFVEKTIQSVLIKSINTGEINDNVLNSKGTIVK